MPKTIQTGKQGEEQACRFLTKQRYVILERNWRHKNLEIDIIARQGDELVFVEVKTRHNDDFGSPESFVTKSKQQKLLRAAHEYIQQKNTDTEARFDIIAVTNQSRQITHIPNAFYAGLR